MSKNNYMRKKVYSSRVLNKLRLVALSIPENGDLQIAQIKKHIKLGQWEESIKLLEKLPRIEDDSDALIYLGLAYYSTELYDEAIQALEKTISLCPHHVEAHRLLLMMYIQANRYEQVIKLSEQSLMLIFEDTELQLDLAKFYYRLGKYTDAAETLERAITVAPDIPDFHYLLGRAYLNLGNEVKAFYAFRRATELDSNYSIEYDELNAAPRLLLEAIGRF